MCGHGRPGGSRTRSRPIWNRLLCQLSFGPRSAAQGRRYSWNGERQLRLRSQHRDGRQFQHLADRRWHGKLAVRALADIEQISSDALAQRAWRQRGNVLCPARSLLPIRRSIAELRELGRDVDHLAGVVHDDEATLHELRQRSLYLIGWPRQERPDGHHQIGSLVRSQKSRHARLQDGGAQPHVESGRRQLEVAEQREHISCAVGVLCCRAEGCRLRAGLARATCRRAREKLGLLTDIPAGADRKPRLCCARLPHLGGR